MGHWSLLNECAGQGLLAIGPWSLVTMVIVQWGCWSRGAGLWSVDSGHRPMVFGDVGQGVLVKGFWSLVVGHWPPVMCHLSLVWGQLLFLVFDHSSLVISHCSLVCGCGGQGRWSLVTGYWSFGAVVRGCWSRGAVPWSQATGQWLLVIGLWSLAIGGAGQRVFNSFRQWSFSICDSDQHPLTNAPNDQRPTTKVQSLLSNTDNDQ